MGTQDRSNGRQNRGSHRQHLPVDDTNGFPQVVVDVPLLCQVVLVGFGLPQETPGTGHLCDFAKQVTYLDLNSDVDGCGAAGGEEDCEAKLEMNFQNWAFQMWPVR